MLAAARTLSISIDRPVAQVYRLVSDPSSLPTWARAFCRSIRRTDQGWIAETTAGTVGIRFAPANDSGILDHVVTLASGAQVVVPMRVVANGTGSEVVFTLFRAPTMSDADWQRDAGLVERDLGTLKRVVESAAGT
ncbi:MAG: SRPBCC family protein [Planctomycetes bacterium]|nr:SRPBCC family protein [Planctomycetota bacterium]